MHKFLKLENVYSILIEKIVIYLKIYRIDILKIYNYNKFFKIIQIFGHYFICL